MAPAVRAVTEADRPWVRALIERYWGVPVVTPTAVYDAPEWHAGVVAEIDGERAGVVTYVPDGRDWEIVSVIATVQGAGVGRAMLEHVRQLAESAGAHRLWLITPDTGAAPFYERIGMTRTRTHESFIDAVRRVKPSVGGFQDAYEFEWRIAPPGGPG